MCACIQALIHVTDLHCALSACRCALRAPQLAANAQLYVNDAFGTAHRAHASTEGVTKFLKPSVSGFLLQKVSG